MTNSGYKYRLPRRVSFDVIQNAIPWKNGVEKWHPRTLKLVSRLLLKCRGMLLAFSSSFCGLTEHGTLWRPMVPSDAAYTHPSVSQNHGTDTCTTKSAKKRRKMGVYITLLTYLSLKLNEAMNLEYFIINRMSIYEKRYHHNNKGGETLR